MQVELCAYIPPGSVSGIGRYTRELYRHLSGRLPVRLVRPRSSPLSRLSTFFNLFPIGIEGHQPGSIVHFNQIMGCSLMLWRPVRPAVATVHDLGVLVCPEDRVLFRPLDRWALDMQLAGLRRMDLYAVNSEATRRGLVELLGIPRERIHFVQLGVDVEQFRPIANAQDVVASRYGILPAEGIYTLLYVGSELPRKNLRLLLRTMALLKERGYPLRLVKVGGPGEMRWRTRFQQDVAQLDLGSQVIIVGIVPDEDLPLFYNVADLCVTPTLIEGGFAWLAMEAMACGRPSLATVAAHVPREAEEAVKVVSGQGVEGFAKGIAECLDDDALRQRMGQAGRRLIMRYTWDRTADEMTRVYSAASAKGRG